MQDRASSLKFTGLCLTICLFLAVTAGCSDKGRPAREELSSPRKTYLYWIKAGVEGDFIKSTDCISEASLRMMDQMAKQRDEFMRRMTANAAVFKAYSVIEERISGDKAVVLTESPDKKARVAVPFALEGKEWRVDLVKMFGG